jgi:hypothetical protein
MESEQIRPLGRAALGAVADAARRGEPSRAELAIVAAAAATRDALADVRETTLELKEKIEAAKARGRMDCGDR